MWNSRPPPFTAKTILNFHFDYLNPSPISGGGVLFTGPKKNCKIKKKVFLGHPNGDDKRSPIMQSMQDMQNM